MSEFSSFNGYDVCDDTARASLGRKAAYASSSTAAATAAKTASTSGGDFTLESGASVIVKFANGNTASNPTLNVDNTGAKAIYMNGAAIDTDLEENGTYQFVYNGTQFDLVGGAGSGGGTTIVQIPSVVVGTYTYDGTAQGPTVSGLDTEHVTITDATKINAGTYTLTAALNDPTKMVWSDMTTANKTWQYTIDKANQTITLSKSSVSLNASTMSDTVTATLTGGGTLSVQSSDTSVATASISNGTITIEAQATGSATITVTASGTSNYNEATETISATVQLTSIYGVQWDGSSTTVWSRTDASALFTNPTPAVNNGNGSSPFDTLMPWSGMERVTDSEGGTLVKIPKFYYKWTVSGSSLKLQIADGPSTGFSVAPAFMDRGDGAGERDLVYVGAYHCASTFKSTTGVKPHANITRDAFRTGISNLGSKIWQWDYAMLVTIWMLYLVEYADWNSQAVIGYGCGNNSGTENMGSTDAMTYHTGTNAANRTTYGHVRYRWIEDLWGNVYDWCDGIYFSGEDVYAIKNPASFSDTTGGTKVGTRPTSSNYISAFAKSSASGFDWFIYPSAVSGTESTYVCDYCDYYASGVVLRVGGNYGQYQDYGLFCLDGSGAASHAPAYVGSRLQKLP